MFENIFKLATNSDFVSLISYFQKQLTSATNVSSMTQAYGLGATVVP